MIDLRKIFKREKTMNINIEPLTADELSDQCFENMIETNTNPDTICENAFNAMIEDYEKEQVLFQDTIDGPHEKNI